MKKNLIAICFATVALAACSKEAQTTPEKAVSEPVAASTAAVTSSTPATPEPTAKVSSTESALDWAGTYKGTLPCADCDGIQTVLILNADKTYTMTQTYLGSKEVNNNVSSQGTFAFDANKPAIITLKNGEEGRQLFVGENYIDMLNMEGQKITGPLADQYRLTKE